MISWDVLKSGQQVKGGDAPPLFCPGEAASGVLCPMSRPGEVSKGEVSSGWSQALYIGAQQQNKGQRAQTGTEEIL